MAPGSPGCADAREGTGRGTPSAKGDQVNLSRMGGLGVAVAASLATIAAMLAPAVAQASASGGSPSPAVTHYTGTPGVARLVPRQSRPSERRRRHGCSREGPAGCRLATSRRRRRCPARRRRLSGRSGDDHDLSSGQLQRRQQPGQPVHQLRANVRTAGPGAVQGQRLRARAGQLRVPHLPHDRGDEQPVLLPECVDDALHLLGGGERFHGSLASSARTPCRQSARP